MTVDSNKIHKIVFEDDGATKVVVGYVIDENDHYVTLQFLKDKRKIHIYHKQITSILEQGGQQ